MIALMTGKELPTEITEILRMKEGMVNLTFISGGFDVFITLDRISKEEEDAFFDKFHILYRELDIPFLILSFNTYVFDIPIYRLNKETGNAFNIYLVEKEGYILKGIRVASLENSILQKLLLRISEIASYDSEKVKEIVTNVYKTYDSITIAQNAMFAQSFNAVDRESDAPIIFNNMEE